MAEIKRKEEKEIQKTSIEWVRNPDGSPGYTWNPITGCLNGCPYCYAHRLANGRLKQRYLANQNIARPIPDDASHRYEYLADLYDDPFYPRFWPEKVKDMDMFGKKKTYAINIRKPKGIFVCDMGELFGDWVSEHWQESIFLAIKSNPQYRFYILTKQPQNLAKWSPFPSNCWVGVTATNQSMYDTAVYHLNRIQAKIKYISIEPLLSHIHLPNYKDVDWIIIGAQTHPYKPPKIEWVKEIVEAADRAGAKVFLKNNLLPLVNIPLDLGSNYRLTYYDEKAGYHKLRQEMPASP